MQGRFSTLVYPGNFHANTTHTITFNDFADR